MSDPEWQIDVTNTDSRKGQFAASCSKTGYCWYWSPSKLWVYGENRVRKVPLPLEENEHLLNCFLLSPQVGWIVSSAGLLQTADGGNSWVRVPVPDFDSGKGRIHAVYFHDEKRGWIAGGEYRPRVDNEVVPNNAISADRKSVLVPAVRKTVDGGLNWQTTKIAKSVGRFDRIVFFGDTGLVSGDAGLQASSDGGTSWKDALLAVSPRDTGEKPEVKATFLLDELRGWASLSGAELLATEDGGRSWKESPVSGEDGLDDASFTEIVFVNESRGLALQTHLGVGELYKTKDAGKTWIPLSIKSSFSGLALVPGTNRIITFGDDGVYCFSPQ